MDRIVLFSALKGSASPAQESSTRPRSANATAATSAAGQKKFDSEDDASVLTRVGALPLVHGTDEHESLRHAKVHGTTAAGVVSRPVVISHPLGAAASAAAVGAYSSFSSPTCLQHVNDGNSDVPDMGSATQHHTAGEQTGATAAAAATTASLSLSSSPVYVPLNAVPASRFQNIYGGSVYLPPGTTKRALGRLRLLWCCVLTQESWHSSFVAGPILFFTTIFVTLVVPPREWSSYLRTFVLTVSSLTCLTLSVTMDPGIIPPAPLSELPRVSTTVTVDGKTVECKVCKTCHILRPPRSSHCKFCDVCVEEFDHHCGVLGSCVAKRTFRFFGGFFIFTTLLALYVGIRSFVILVSTDFSKGNENVHLLGVAAGSVVCILAAILGGAMVVPCAGRYIVLSATNETTKETMRREQHLEWERLSGCVPVAEMHTDGYCKNLFSRFFSPLGRSRIPFDYYV